MDHCQSKSLQIISKHLGERFIWPTWMVVCRLGSLYVGEEDLGVFWFPVRLVNGSGENSGACVLELSHDFGDHVNEGLGF